MNKFEKPEDMLLRLCMDFVAAAYSFCVLVATGIVLAGKLLFDTLYKVMRLDQKSKRNYVECEVINKENQ